jgi:hypothetical protein
MAKEHTDNLLESYLDYMENPSDYSEGEGEALRNRALARFDNDTSKLAQWVQAGQRKRQAYFKDWADAIEEDRKRSKQLENKLAEFKRRIIDDACKYGVTLDLLGRKPTSTTDLLIYELGQRGADELLNDIEKLKGDEE